MMLEIQPCNWGDANPRDIGMLLKDAALHINGLVDEPVADHIKVITAPHDKDYPMTHYRNPRGEGPITIQLTPHGQYWAQFTYQFAHEFCHVLSDYERLEGNPNEWFHEALCELSSIFVLYRMKDVFDNNPLYNIWEQTSIRPGEYADRRLSDSNRQLPPGETLAQWLHRHEEELRTSRHYDQDQAISGYARDQYAVVAYQLLPIFEANPGAWNAVRSLPTSDGMINDYLLDWYRQVAPKDQAVIGCIMELFSEHLDDYSTRRGAQTH